MRILHTADWHLGLNLSNVSLFEEQQAFVETLVRIVHEEDIDVILIAGDIFDHAVSSPAAISLYGRAMTALCHEAGKTVLICAGNHDGAARLSSCSELLKKTGLFIAGKIGRNMKPVVIGDCAFHLLPFFGAEEVRELYPEMDIRTYHEAMTVMTDMLGDNLVPGKRNILAAHCFAAGAEVSESDRSAMVGGSNIVGLEAFDSFDYVALGHLHRCQNMSGKIHYSGSPLKYSFSEATHQKSVTFIDTADMSFRTVPIKPLRDLRVLKGTYEEVLAEAERDPVKNDYLKIELTDVYAGMEARDTFRAIYGDHILSIIGKPMEAENQKMSLTPAELSSLSPRDILARFYEEIAGAELDETLISWFDRAEEHVDKGGDLE